MNLEEIYDELKQLEAHVVKTAEVYSSWIKYVDPRYAASARNLLRYVALRQKDLRKLQIALGIYGLTLSQCERYVLRNIREVLARVESTLIKPTLADERETISWDDAKHLLHEHSRAVFGLPLSMAPASEPHQAIMVTADELMTQIHARELMLVGASILRINAAHGSEKTWMETVGHWRKASAETGKKTSILLDVAGPKLRTGRATMPFPVLKFRPVRAFDGRVLKPFSVELKCGPQCIVSREVWTLPGLQSSQRVVSLSLIDGRGRKRKFPVIWGNGGNLRLEGDRTCYLKAGCKLVLEVEGESQQVHYIQNLELADAEVVLSVGDLFKMVTSSRYEQCVRDIPVVECLEASVVLQLQPGQLVSFDDGRVVSRVCELANEEVKLKVEMTAKPLVTLRSDKGINLPDAPSNIPLLSLDDIAATEF